MFSVGWHVSVGGNRNGIGAHFQQLDAAGIPIFLVSIGDYGPIGEVVLLAQASGIDHQLVFRVVGLDVPNYGVDPATAALHHWEGIKGKLPPEFDKERVWVCPINEIDRNRSDWMGDFATAFAALAIGEGYKVTMFAWSSGEPEPEHWHTAGMRRYLELCAINPTKAAVSLHEYSYDVGNIKDGYPYKVGRFQALFAACDAMGLARPTVHITEWGWEHENVPEPGQALADIDWAYRIYAPHEQIKGAAIWYLGAGFGGIANKAQPLIEPVTAYMLNAPAVPPVTPPPVEPPPDPTPPGDETLTEHLWRVSIEQQVISLNPKAALQAAIFAAGFVPVESESRTVHGDIEYAFQAAERLSDGARRVWYCKVPEWNNVKWTAEPGDVPPPPAFTFTHWPTTSKTINQAFGANPQYYAQFGLPGHEGVDIAAGLDAPIYAVAPGVVVATGDDRLPKSQGGHNYGVRVYIDHQGGDYQTIYAHLNSRLVNVGDAVTAGEQIGLADTTGNSTGHHLHLTLKKAGATASGETNYPLDIVDPTPFLAPLMGTPPPVPGGELIDLRQFKVAHPDAWRVVRGVDEDGNTYQEDVQDLELSGGLYVRRKNDNAEWHKIDGNFFYLVHDTSPAVGKEGVPRVYTLYKNGQPGAPKSKVVQAVGELWQEAGTHHVQFKAKDGCRLLSENSGAAQNSSVITAHERNYRFNTYGQNLVLDEVIFEKTGVETQIYARHQGKAIGWCGWSAPWGSAEPVEIYFDRGRLTQEPKRWCNW